MNNTPAQIAALSGTAMGGQVRQADDLRRMADKVALQRPDLTQAVILEQIMKLGSQTVHSPSHWAQVCIGCANLGISLPWEPDYRGPDYLAILPRNSD